MNILTNSWICYNVACSFIQQKLIDLNGDTTNDDDEILDILVSSLFFMRTSSSTLYVCNDVYAYVEMMLTWN